ncbi:hypothetical protein C8R45DRAFT_945442 [Mycena sanguinolenta]|nr:hypothetical protein C8R45DRAFT_945442 [Mycena sanguinolenta]
MVMNGAMDVPPGIHYGIEKCETRAITRCQMTVMEKPVRLGVIFEVHCTKLAFKNGLTSLSNEKLRANVIVEHLPHRFSPMARPYQELWRSIYSVPVTITFKHVAKELCLSMKVYVIQQDIDAGLDYKDAHSDNSAPIQRVSKFRSAICYTLAISIYQLGIQEFCVAYPPVALFAIKCHVRNSNTINWGSYVDYACYEAYGYDNSHRCATGTMGVYEGKTAPPTFL